MDFESFQAVFGVLLEAANKRDESGMLAEMYWDSISKIEPTDDELWQAVSEHLDQQGGKLPPARDLKSAIWEKRKRSQPALPEAQPEKVSYEQAKQNRIVLMREIYKGQGDTEFYRKMLSGSAGVWASLVKNLPAVTHDDVMAAIANERT